MKRIKSSPEEVRCETHKEGTNAKRHTERSPLTIQRLGDDRRPDGAGVWGEGRAVLGDRNRGSKGTQGTGVTAWLTRAAGVSPTMSLLSREH